MTNSPFEGTDSPYGPAAGVGAPHVVPHAATPATAPPPPGLGMTAGLPATGYTAPPAYRPYVTAPRAARRPRNVPGGWSLGLGIAAFVFSVGGAASTALGTMLGVTALALGILALVIARDGVRPRGTAIWGICLSALPVVVAVFRFVGDVLSSLR